jgi:hypothetical protein
VDVVAVGTGQALELGRRSDADVVLVHCTATRWSSSPIATAATHVISFVVSAAADPAKVAGGVGARRSRPSRRPPPFEARGQVGPHIRITIRASAKVTPAGCGTVVGQDGRRVLANEKQAYDVDRDALSSRNPSPGAVGGGRLGEPRFQPAQPVRRWPSTPTPGVTAKPAVRRGWRRNDATRDQRLRRETVRAAALLPGFGQLRSDNGGVKVGGWRFRGRLAGDAEVTLTEWAVGAR